MTAYDVVVVGGGLMGGFVAYQLAATTRCRVLVCEQGRVSSEGATSRSGALIRQQHTTHCVVPLAVEGLRVFRQWAARVGGSCGYARTGFAMVVSAALADRLDKNIAAVNEVGGEARRLDSAELARLHPALVVPRDAAIGYEPDGGYADPVRATLTLVEAAVRDHGVSVREGARVTAIGTKGGRVTGVRTDFGDVSAGQVVICGGAWSAGLIAPFGSAPIIEPRRIGVAQAAAGLSPGDLPIGIDDISGTYFRPAPEAGLYFGVPLDPAVRLDATPAPVGVAEARETARRLSAQIPALRTAPLVGSRVGFDAYTPDRQPVIGQFGPEGMYLCSGFSGGGVKLAPAIAAQVAKELSTGESSTLLEPFRPSRFTDGSPIEKDFSYENS